MQNILLLLVIGLALLVGMAAGLTLAEVGMRERERRVAQQRRELATRTRALR